MKRALVLGGGGAKGAYEIGAWKAFRELGIEFDIVVGTSIGALNGALITQDKFDEAIEIWSTLSVDSILDQGIDLDLDFELLKEQAYRYHNFLKHLIYRRSLDVKPFKELIDRSLDEDLMRNSKLEYGLCCVNISKFKPVLITLAEMEIGSVKEYLYASAACFPAFPLAEINGDKYIDGGYYDNLPIQLAQRMGADEFYCVDLSTNPLKGRYLEYENTHFIKLYHPISSFLNFQQEMSLRNIDYGYYDTLKVMGKYTGFAYTFKKDDNKYKNMLFSKLNTNYQRVLKMLGFEETADFIYRCESDFVSTYFQIYDDPTLNDFYLRVGELIGENFNFIYNYVYEYETFNKMLKQTTDEYEKVYLEYRETFKLQKRSFKEMYDILSGVNKCLILVFLKDLLDDLDNEINRGIIKAWMRIHYTEIIKAIYLYSL